MIFQIYYDEKQKSKLLHFTVPYYNEGLTIFFENSCIEKLVSECKEEKIGVLSWKLSEKMRRHQLQQLITTMDTDYNVLALKKFSQRHCMLAMANVWHPSFMKTIKLLWQKLGLDMPSEAKYPIYNNHFIAKTEIYKDYVDNFLSPAMELTLADEEMNNLMTQPSGYSKLNRHADTRRVKEKLGMDDYPLSTYILER
jgi:hypothetical protein